jgi:hypothetical protein
MAQRAESSFIPRDFLLNPREFGRVYRADSRTGVRTEDFGRLMSAIIQHRAACAVREVRRADSITNRALAQHLRVDESLLSGYMRGAYPASLTMISNWSYALGDPSIFPDFDEIFSLVRASVS